MTTTAWHESIYSAGWIPGSAGTLTVTAPATGEELARVGLADAADLDRAVAGAKEAQRAWGGAPYVERAAVLRRAAQLLEADPSRLAGWLVPESGSAQAKAAFEVGLVVEELYECAAVASAPPGQLLRSVKPRLSYARRVPYGVVGVVAPFNFPAILAMRSVAPALAVGNAVVLKPDPRTPIAGGLALAELLEEAGLPEGVLHVLPGGAEVGQALVAHPDVPCLSFTGSTPAGRAIGEAAGPLLKTVHLELGGNNALVVLPDADVAAAASVGAWSSFLHQGQICMTAGRHLVHRSLVDEYTALLAEKADKVPVGDPTDGAVMLGPLIDERQLSHVDGVVSDSVAAGARLVAGGTHEGLLYRPTVLADVPLDSRAWQEEIFGPVAPVVAYDDVDEAIELVNGSEFGLSVSLLTSNAYAAVELADRIHSGAVHVNDSTVDDEAVAPFGGIKASGVGGRFGGAAANLETFCETQWVTVQGRPEQYPF
ncbi:aldehyde dehydrogenase family protein [Nocardioides cheoyonin]|uniref:aldehyde dehydrogenase family protein n=1 Tax=Nocardioides cheoyonin TaxID=3156615 RepID=UPI0032B5D671